MKDTLERKFETVDKGLYCGDNSPASYVVRTQAEWQVLWTRTNSIRFPEPPAPKINFAREMVLGICLGSRRSGGYDIEISNLLERDDCLEVYVTESAPTPRDVGIYAYTLPYQHAPTPIDVAFTQPYHLVKTAKTKKEVNFIKSLPSQFTR